MVPTRTRTQALGVGGVVGVAVVQSSLNSSEDEERLERRSCLASLCRSRESLWLMREPRDHVHFRVPVAYGGSIPFKAMWKVLGGHQTH